MNLQRQFMRKTQAVKSSLERTCLAAGPTEACMEEVMSLPRVAPLDVRTFRPCAGATAAWPKSSSGSYRSPARSRGLDGSVRRLSLYAGAAESAEALRQSASPGGQARRLSAREPPRCKHGVRGCLGHLRAADPCADRRLERAAGGAESDPFFGDAMTSPRRSSLASRLC